MINDEMEKKSQLIIYQNINGEIKIDVHLENETVWLNQAQMAELFNKNKRTISEHIRNVFNEGELIENSVVRKFRTTTRNHRVRQIMNNRFNDVSLF